jgi:interferon-induced helicase C domain-containing protein 1
MFQQKHCEEESIKLPQIVGLTASPGIGKKEDKFKAKEHLLELLSNLDVEVIKTYKLKC